MAIEVFFESADGVMHEKAYAKSVQINVNTLDKTGQITFNVYHDEKSRKEKKLPVVQHGYNLTPELYEKHIQPAIDALIAATYELAKETHDIDSGVKDKENKPVMVGFFEGGKDV